MKNFIKIFFIILVIKDFVQKQNTYFIDFYILACYNKLYNIVFYKY